MTRERAWDLVFDLAFAVVMGGLLAAIGWLSGAPPLAIAIPSCLWGGAIFGYLQGLARGLKHGRDESAPDRSRSDYVS